MKNKRILCAVIAVFLLVSIFTAQIEAGDTSSAFDGYVSELIRMIEEKIEKWKDYSVDHSAFEALSRRPDSFTLPKAADDEIKSIISVIITEENAQFYAENAVIDNDMCDSASVDLNDYYLEYYADLNFSEQFAESGYDPGTVWNLLSYPVICIPIYGEIDQQRHVTGRIELKYSQYTDYYDVSVVSYVQYTGRDEDKYIFEPVDNILKRAEKYRGDENTQIIVMRSVIDVGIAVMIWTDGGRAVYDYRNSCENPEYGFMDPRIYEFIEYEFEDYFALREQHEKKCETMLHGAAAYLTFNNAPLSFTMARLNLSL